MNKLYKDTAIKENEEDILGFNTIVDKLSKNIINYEPLKNEGSFTLAIEGQWGSGKTSLINLVENKLKEKNQIIMHFTPWMVTSFEQLIKYFFKEFNQVLIHNSTIFQGPKAEELKKDLKKFLSFIAPDSIEIGTEGAKFNFNIKDKFFNTKEKTIYELKENINKNLCELEQKIIIIVDDIDRLTDNETETFFRLIKGILDFDYLMFILLYDKAIVSKSLETFKRHSYEKYLDKIVQYSITMPKIEEARYFRVLDDYKNKIKDKSNFDDKQWYSAKVVFQKVIPNIRDIKKVFNNLSFTYDSIKEDVNFIDFFILTIIKTQSIFLYENIKENGKNYISESKNKENISAIFQNELKEYKKFEDLFRLLFNLHTKEKGINNINHFDTYFTLEVAEKILSTKEFKEIEELFFQENTSSILSKLKNLSFMKQDQFLIDFKKSHGQTKDTIIVMNLLKIDAYIDFRIRPNFQKYIVDLLFNINKESLIEKIFSKQGNVPLYTKINVYIRLYEFNKDNTPKFFENALPDIYQDLKDELEKLTIILMKDKFNTPSYYKTFTLNSLYIYCKDYFDIDIKKINQNLESFMLKSKENLFSILKTFQKKDLYIINNIGITENGDVIDKEKLFQVCNKEKIIKKIESYKLSKDEEYIFTLLKRKDRIVKN